MKQKRSEARGNHAYNKNKEIGKTEIKSQLDITLILSRLAPMLSTQQIEFQRVVGCGSRPEFHGSRAGAPASLDIVFTSRVGAGRPFSATEMMSNSTILQLNVLLTYSVELCYDHTILQSLP